MAKGPKGQPWVFSLTGDILRHVHVLCKRSVQQPPQRPGGRSGAGRSGPASSRLTFDPSPLSFAVSYVPSVTLSRSQRLRSVERLEHLTATPMVPGSNPMFRKFHSIRAQGAQARIPNTLETHGREFAPGVTRRIRYTSSRALACRRVACGNRIHAPKSPFPLPRVPPAPAPLSAGSVRSQPTPGSSTNPLRAPAHHAPAHHSGEPPRRIARRRTRTPNAQPRPPAPTSADPTPVPPGPGGVIAFAPKPRTRGTPPMQLDEASAPDPLPLPPPNASPTVASPTIRSELHAKSPKSPSSLQHPRDEPLASPLPPPGHSTDEV